MSRPLIRLISAAALLATAAVVLLARQAWFTPTPAATPGVPLVVSSPPVASAGAPPLPTTSTAATTQGEQLEVDGNYTGAVALLQPYVGHGSPTVDAATRLALARALFEDGRAADARDAANALRATYPGSAEADLAQFILGEAQQQLGNYAAAFAAYRAFDTRYPELNAYVQLQIAASLQAENQFSQAQAIDNAVVAGAPIPAVSLDALEAVRGVQTLVGDFHSYLATTNRLLSMAPDATTRAQFTYERAWAEQAIQDSPAAIADYRTVVVSWPTNSFAPRALTGLAQLNATSAVTPNERGIVLYDSGQYSSAIGVFSRAIQSNTGSDAAWYYRALCRLQSGDDAGAQADLLGLVDGFPTSQYAGAALYQAGRLQEDAGQLADAQKTYQTLVDRYTSAPQAVDGRFRLGLLQYLKHDYAAAETSWSAAGLSGANAARAEFWLGKARGATGDQVGERFALQSAAAADPDGYYGLRAQTLLSGGATPVPPSATPAPHPAPPLTSSPAASPTPGTALASWFQAQGTSAAQALITMQTDPGYRRSSLLLDLGLRSQAGDEITALTSRDLHHPAALATLASLLTDRGDWRTAYPIALQAMATSRALHLPVPPQVEALAYPMPFAAQVAAASSKRGVDPLLLLALMRQESSYVPTAQSPAGALGLTQVMPSTGQSIAAALGISDFQTGQLLQPAVNIDFGAYYLAEQLKHYKGNLFAAIAAYNAGDSAVDSWLAQPGASDPDVFAELIPYHETHAYLQIVYANYLHYRYAYGASTP